MRRLFRRKKSVSDLKVSNLKIPIPMIGGIQYSDMTESQISTLIGGGNKGDQQPFKKKAPSLSSSHTNNTDTAAAQRVAPTRSISSPPVLVMPKPLYSLPPTRFLLRSHGNEKTQIENNSSNSSSDEEYGSDLSEDLHDAQSRNATSLQSSSLSINIDAEFKETQQFINNISPPLNEPAQNNKVYQSGSPIARTSDDSNRQYISASGSPVLNTGSSVSNMKSNSEHTLRSHSFSSAHPTFITAEEADFLLPDENINSFPSNNIIIANTLTLPPSSAPTKAFDANLFTVSPYNDYRPLSNDTSEWRTNEMDSSISRFPDVPEQMISEDGHMIDPSNYHQATHSHHKVYSSSSSQPITIAISNKNKDSQSASLATVGLNVAPISQNKHVNNNDIAHGDQLYSFPSQQPIQNDNNKNYDLLRSQITKIDELQNQMQRLAMNEDLEELKRTVDRIQQQYDLERQEHLVRVREQEMKERNILDQISLTKKILDMAIEKKLFNDPADSLENIASSSNSQNQTPIEQSRNTLANVDNINTNKVKRNNSSNSGNANLMKSSASSSSARNNSRKESGDNMRNLPMEQNQIRNRRSAPMGPNQAGSLNLRHPPQPVGSYFPDILDEDDYDIIDEQYGMLPPFQLPPPPPPLIPNKLRNFNMLPPQFPPNARNGYNDMEFAYMKDPMDAFDSPRMRRISQQRRPRSKSVESRWPPQDFLDQQRQPPPHFFEQDMAGPPLDEPYFTPRISRARPRKLSQHSQRSNYSDARVNDGLPHENPDLLNYHSAEEEEEQDDRDDGGQVRSPGSGRHHSSDGLQQGQFRQPRHPNNHNTRHPPPPMLGNLNGPMPPPNMLYNSPSFGPPPPHVQRMGMMNDREMMNMRLPPYGYNPNGGGEYYPPFMHPSQVSPGMMAAFAEEHQWNGGGPSMPPPPHPQSMQWGPRPGNGGGAQNMYGMHPSENPGGMNPISGNNSGASNLNNAQHLQDMPDALSQQNPNFGRRFPPPQPAPLQQPPQQPKQGYMPLMYTDAPHNRLYM